MPSQTRRAFYTLDADLRLVAASPNTLRLWGKKTRDVIGRKLVEVFPWVDGGPVHEALQQALQTYQPVRLRVNSLVMAKPVEVEIYPVRDGLQVSFAPADGPA